MKRQADEVNNKIMQSVETLGGNASKYQRERERALRAVLTELYSPPRVSAMAKMCPSYGILLGFASDLTTTDSDCRNLDFDDATMTERPWAKIKAEEPLLILGSTMCTAFSAWQNINNPKQDQTIVANEFRRGMMHLDFCLQIYEHQNSRGRYFLHEHPAQASSCGVKRVRRLLAMPGVERVVGHQCPARQEAYGFHGQLPRHC